MGFNPGQQVVYEYDNRTGIVTGLKRGERWQVKFSDGENMYIPESKLTAIDKEDMFDSFSAGRFQGSKDTYGRGPYLQGGRARGFPPHILRVLCRMQDHHRTRHRGLYRGHRPPCPECVKIKYI